MHRSMKYSNEREEGRKGGRSTEKIKKERKKGEIKLSEFFNKQKERKKIGKMKHYNDRWQEERKNEELKKGR